MAAINGTSEFQPVHDRITSSLVKITKATGQISAEDVDFHRSANPELPRSLDAQSSRLLQLTQKLFQAATTTGTNVRPPRALRDAEDIEENWRSAVDVVDHLLERADSCLDEYTGVIKRLGPGAVENTSTLTEYERKRAESLKSRFQGKLLPKPQLLFDRKIDNQDINPFKPLLRTKPHAVVSLEESIGDGALNGYHHPYSTETERYSYPKSVRQASEPVNYQPPTESEVIFVDTQEGFEEMLAELRESTEIAIDLEHHDTHSYIGIVCLMQISTRKQDWVIDTLVPWREELQALNEVFANPAILKVLHGSHSDMIWLQRDLGLYVVGLFDTFHASSALTFPARSLKYLLQRFCNFEANKKLQTADWRLRPLPQDMMDYARSDTHFLLFVYDHLRNMLLEASTPDNDLINYVEEKSKVEALQKYERPVYDAARGLGSEGWFGCLHRKPVRFTPEQLSVFRAVHEWRDQAARLSDEGVNFVMSISNLFAVADAMPVTVPKLVHVTKPVSKAVSESFDELISIIKKAIADGRKGPTFANVMRDNADFLPRWKKPKTADRDQPDIGLGATLQMLNKSDNTEGTAERTFVSRLWGQVARPVSASAVQLAASLMDALNVVLPLPTRGTGAPETNMADTPVKTAAQDHQQSSHLQITPATEGIRTEEGTTPDINGSSKRKADAADLDEYVGLAKLSGKEKKRLKRVAWEERNKDRPLGNRKETDAAQDTPIVAFDYAGAESILRPAEEKTPKGKKPKVSKNFDPYAKASEASTGPKKPRVEIAGRSFTFKR